MGEGKDEGESLGFDMPWHIATLIKEWAQYIVPLCFFNSFVGAWVHHALSKSVIARNVLCDVAISSTHPAGGVSLATGWVRILQIIGFPR
jgi:hypothetical protein